MNEEMNAVENEETNDQLRDGQLADRLANETGLSLDFVSRCLDGDMDALAQLDERDDRQLKLLLAGLYPLWAIWLLTMYETSLPELNLRTGACEWRLAFGKPILPHLTLIVREILAARPEFLATEEKEIDELLREQILKLTALTDAQHAEIFGCSVDAFRKIRRRLSGRGLVRFDPVGEDRFRIYVRSNAQIWRDVVVPLMELEKWAGFFERFPPPLVQTIQ